MRRSLFEDAGGMLITIPDAKVFLLLIGNLTVYICASLPSLSYFMLIWLWIVGTPAVTSDKSKELTLHAHDECNVSDVFGWHIFICKRSPNSLLFIVATIVPNPICQGCSHSSTCDLFYASGDTLFDCYLASEVFLQRMMVLYVASHYKNQPNDLQPMSDASAYHLFVLHPPIKDDVWREGWGIWSRCWVLHNFNNISSVCWMGRE